MKPGMLSAVLIAVLALAAGPGARAAVTSSASQSLAHRAYTALRNDYRHFYSGDRLLRLGFALGAGAVIANTGADNTMQDWYQKHLRGGSSDDIADVAKQFGEQKYLIPASLLMAGIGELLPPGSATGPIGEWGRRTLRAYAVGYPAMLLLQHGTGGSRPGETNHSSHWRPFQDDNGASGHAFVGAVPFLTLAHMSDSRPLRYLWYGVSALSAWSRINDNAHFPSQALLGWYAAYEATGAVNDSERDNRQLHLSVLPVAPDGAQLVLSKRW